MQVQIIVNETLTVKELIAELMLLPDHDLPILFAAVSPHDPFDRVAHRVMSQNFTQEQIVWDDGIGEYRIVDDEHIDCAMPIAWVMN